MVRHAVKRDPSFGERIRGAMEQARIRPSELARRMDVHPVTVTRWRRGEMPSLLRLPQLAQGLGVPLEWLKGEQETTMSGEAISGAAPRPSPPSGQPRPERAADRAIQEMGAKVVADLSAGPAMVPKMDAIAMVIRILEARKATPPSGDEEALGEPALH